MHWKASFDALTKNAKSFGVTASLKDAAYRAAGMLVPVVAFKGMTAVLADVDASLLDPTPYRGSFVTKEELIRSLQCAEWAEQMSTEFIDAALSRGDRCFGLFSGEDSLVSVGWYSHAPTEVSQHLEIHFDPTWVYMYKGYTLKAHRGKRLHGIGMSLALERYTRENFKGLISYVEINNFSSLRSVRKMGYRIFGEVRAAVINGRPRLWASRGCGPYHFRLRPRPKTA